jgi:hypothetical protein
MLCNFLVYAIGLRAAVRDVWDAYDTQLTHTAKKWARLGFSLYFISFLIGVIALIRFCTANLRIFCPLYIANPDFVLRGIAHRASGGNL